MTKRAYAAVLVVFALLVLAAIAMRGDGDGLFANLFRTLHGH
jgi:hypothetical protein